MENKTTEINAEAEVCQFCGSDNLERIMNSIICADCRRKVRDMSKAEIDEEP